MSERDERVEALAKVLDDRVEKTSTCWLWTGTLNRGNCVNPDHLEPVTNRVNILRGIGRSAIAARRDSCAKGHPYVPGSWYFRTNRYGRKFRCCRECRNADKRMRRAADKRARMAVKFASVCPTCGVGVGIECISVASGKRLGKSHRQRPTNPYRQIEGERR